MTAQSGLAIVSLRRAQMKVAGRVFLLLSALVMLAAWPASAQQMATIKRNGSDSLGGKENFRALLKERAVQFEAAQKRRLALLRYLSSISPSSADFNVTLQSIKELDTTISTLKQDMERISLLPSYSSGQPEAVSGRHGKDRAPRPTARPNSSSANSKKDVAVKYSGPLKGRADLSSASSAIIAPALACYPDAPPVVLTLLNDAATIIVDRARAGQSDPSDGATSLLNELIVYSLADAVLPADSTDRISLFNLKRIEVRAETKRTDKQVGASPTAGGNTSEVEKPNVPATLGAAVENGSVKQSVSGTSVTFSSSLYAVAAASKGDTATTYKNNEPLTRIGVSATFALENKDDVPANATRKQLEEWVVRARVSGDNSTRSEEFEEFWQEKIRPRIDRIPRALTGFLRSDFTKVSGLEDERRDLVDNRILTPLDAYLTTAGTNPDTRRITELIGCPLKTEWVDRVKSSDVAVSDETRNKVARAVQEIAASELEAGDTLKLINAKIDELNSRMITSLAYTNKRVAMGSDYSIVKLLLEKKMGKSSDWQMDANAGVSIYHKPDRTMNQQSIRDIIVALSLEGNAARSPFLTKDLDESQITYSFKGSYQRMLENRHVAGRKADIASAQFKLEIPIFTGVTLPFSLTYSNSTETSREDRFRANFGITFDADKLLRLRNTDSKDALAP